MKGCGVCNNHGGGCGAQDGETADDCELAGPAMPGKDDKPAGLPIPLLSGANEAPAGFTVGVWLGAVSGNGCSEERNPPPRGDFAGVSE